MWSVNPREALLAVCVALTPERLRKVREEQWSADLRDAPDMGISPTSLLFGAACSSVTARFHDTVHRGGMLLSRSIKGENMKATLGIIGATAAIVGGVVLGVQANAAPSPSPGTYSAKGPIEDRPIGGYEGWWNATPEKGSADHLPQETVSVNTRTNQVVDVFNRAMNDARQIATIADIDFEVVPDPAWPKNSVVIIETASGKVIESFPVDERGDVFH